MCTKDERRCFGLYEETLRKLRLARMVQMSLRSTPEHKANEQVIVDMFQKNNIII